jgi:hypothetical protein
MAVAFAAEARLFDPAKGRDFGGDEAGIDADDPRLQRFDDTPHAGQVAAVK